jgi:adenine-specific DNA-methyltransferase
MPLLHWLTRDADIHAATHAPCRLLEEAPEHSNGDRDTATSSFGATIWTG